MPDLIPFSFESNEIRVVADANGEPLFVAKDVLTALGIDTSNVPSKIKHVPDEWRGRHPIATPGGTQQMAVLAEQGLYFFVARSDKPKALPFQKWVAGEVIPSIRKTGSYSAHPTPAPIPQIELQERTVALAERTYSLSERCTDPVLRVLFLDKAKNLMSDSATAALPNPERAHFQVYEILEGMGFASSVVRKIAAPVGRQVAAAYRHLTGKEPERVERYVDGAVRPVKLYPTSFREDAEAIAAEYLNVSSKAA